MASVYFLVLKRFVIFILLQGLIFNNFDFFGSFFDPIGLKLIKNYISESSFSQKFLYLVSIILIHHFVLFSLEAFSFEFFSLIIYKTFLTSLLTLTFCTTTIYIMIKNEK